MRREKLMSLGPCVQELTGTSLDLTLTLHRGTARSAGVLLRPWLHQGVPEGAPCAAAILVNWETSRLEACSLVCLFGFGVFEGVPEGAPLRCSHPDQWGAGWRQALCLVLRQQHRGAVWLAVNV